ncbi:uncharacterized protein LOC130774033 [Actinidia eriantha]|uniref:uncharacterized protein LOC130774033 n=1 Tax=Actinidia eriantha TaxID=165200 RepID=UPI00258DCFAE|nr:uncharacterized protein LOC130774033 [Actinidia eriantha]XP_057488006.1 uncharacterized protein LOC130774033 [Actinidia eriantha]
MGTHESGPSFLVETLEKGASMAKISESFSLKSWIEENPSVLGDKVVEKWGVNLPFLFKVHHGFYSSYHETTIRPGVLHSVKGEKELYGDINIMVTGHSMGGAIIELPTCKFSYK